MLHYWSIIILALSAVFHLTTQFPSQDPTIQRITLTSPLLKLTTATCLVARLSVGDRLFVDYRYMKVTVTSFAVTSEWKTLQLYRTMQYLDDTALNIDIPSAVVRSLGVLIFEFQKSGGGLAGKLKAIELTNGSCSNKGKESYPLILFGCLLFYVFIYSVIVFYIDFTCVF